MSDAPAEAVIVDNDIFREYKGAFAELYVHNELVAAGITPYYHTRQNSVIEIDFVVQRGVRVVPIEVKAEVSVRSKSLKTFVAQHPDCRALRVSMRPPEHQSWVDNMPLYRFLPALTAD